MNILVAGKLQHDNFGDVLMAGFYLKNKSLKDKCTFYIFNAGDDVLYRLRKINQNVRGLTSWSDLESIDYAILIGGGYFGHTLLNGTKWCREWEEKNRLYELCVNLVDNKIPYVVQSVEVGPIQSDALKQKIEYIFCHANSVHVRNLNSKIYIKKHFGLETKHGGDIVYNHYVSTESASSQFDSEAMRGRAAIHFTDKFIGRNPFKRSFKKAVAQLIRRLVAREFSVTIFTDNEDYMDFSKAYKAFIDEYELTDVVSNIQILRYIDTELFDFADWLCDQNYVLTTKLHAGVIAFARGAVVDCYTDAPKVWRFKKEHPHYHLSNFYLRLSSFAKQLNINKIDIQLEKAASSRTDYLKHFEDLIANEK